MKEFLYSRQHICFEQVDNAFFTACITDDGLALMQAPLTYLEPKGNRRLKAGDVFAVVESNKDSVELAVPCDCEVDYILMTDRPEDIDCYTVIARFKGRLAGNLMTLDEYKEYVGKKS